MGTILSWVLTGFIAGGLARAIMPGKDEMSWGMTLLLGLVGSVAGGLVQTLVTDNGFGLTSTGWIWSTIGALIVLFIYNRTAASKA